MFSYITNIFIYHCLYYNCEAPGPHKPYKIIVLFLSNHYFVHKIEIHDWFALCLSMPSQFPLICSVKVLQTSTVLPHRPPGSHKPWKFIVLFFYSTFCIPNGNTCFMHALSLDFMWKYTRLALFSSNCLSGDAHSSERSVQDLALAQGCQWHESRLLVRHHVS